MNKESVSVEFISNKMLNNGFLNYLLVMAIVKKLPVHRWISYQFIMWYLGACYRSSKTSRHLEYAATVNNVVDDFSEITYS